MKGKRILSIILTIVTMMSLTACASTKSQTSGSTPVPTKDETDNGGNTTGEEKPITLSIAWWGGQTRNEYTQVLLDAYTATHPNITFTPSPSGWDGYFDKLATEAAAGAMPDIVQMDYLYITTYANNGSVADLQPYIDNGTIDVSGIDSVLYNSGKINGKLSGMVLSSSILAMSYNPSVLESAGVKPPTSDWTWKDFINDCNAIADKTDAFGIETNLTDNINVFNYYVRQHGEKLISDDNKSLGYSDDQIFVDFVNMIVDLVKTGAMPNADQYATISTLSKEAFPIVTGDAGFRNDWSNYPTIVEGTNDTLEIVPFPMAEDGTKALWVKPGMFFSVASTATDEKKQAAAEFINWFINSEEANDIIMAERGTPVSSKIRSYLSESGKLSQKQKQMFEFVDSVVPICAEAPAPDPAGMAEVTQEYQLQIYNVLYGNSSAKEAAADFRKNTNDILDRNN